MCTDTQLAVYCKKETAGTSKRPSTPVRGEQVCLLRTGWKARENRNRVISNKEDPLGPHAMSQNQQFANSAPWPQEAENPGAAWVF